MTTTEAAQDYLGSASSLIKALKAPTDPPQPKWPTKVDIALEAWRTKELYLPRKAEVLRDWVLESLTRPQTKSTASNAILEPRYYDLLRLTWQVAPQGSPAPLSLLSAFFNRTTKGDGVREELLESAAKAFELVYRNHRQVKIDAWMEVWKSCLAFLASDNSITVKDSGNATTTLKSLTDVIMSLWRPDELGGDAQVKKITATLCISLTTLIKASSLHPDISALRDYRLFLPVPVLREPEPLQPISSALSSLPVDLVGFTGRTFLPQLLHTTIDQLQRSKYQVFTQPSSSKKSFEVFVSDRLRAAVQAGFKDVLDYLNRVSHLSDVSSSDLWESRARVWGEINQWGGYLESDDAWGSLLQNEAARAKEALQGEEKMQDAKVRDKVIELLDLLESLDHGRADLDPEVIAWCLAAPKHCHTEAEKLLSSVLRYHRLTFSLPTFFDLLNIAIASSLPDRLDPDIAQQIYDLVSNGPLRSLTFQNAIQSAVSGLANPSMRVDILHSLAVDKDRDEEDNADTAKRKRKTAMKTAPAARLALTTQLAVLLLPTGVTWEDEMMYDADVEVLLSHLNNVEEISGDIGFKKHKKSRKGVGPASSEYWTADILLAAKLRLIRSLEIVNRQWKGDRPQGDHLLPRLEDKSALTEIRTEILLSLSQSLLIGTSDLFGLTDDHIRRLIEAWLEALEVQQDESLYRVAWDLVDREGSFVFDSFASDEHRQRLLLHLGGYLAGSATSAAFRDHCRRILGSDTVWELGGFRAALLASLREGLTTNLVPGLLAILAQTPMSVVPRDIRESLSKKLSSDLRSSKANNDNDMLVFEWLARVARDPDTVRWIDPGVLPSIMRGDWDETRPVLNELVRGITRYQLRQSDTSNLAVCLDQLEGLDFERAVGGAARFAVRLFTVLLTTMRDSQEIPRSLQTKLCEALQPTASQLARALSSLVKASTDGDSARLIELAHLYVVCLQLLGGLGLSATTLRIAKDLLVLAAKSTAVDMLPRVSPLIIEIVHEEAGGRYSEQTLAMLTLLNAVASMEEGNAAFGAIMRQIPLDDFASAVESSIAALGLQRNTRPVEYGATASRRTIAHLRTIQTLIGIPLEGSGKVMRKVCVRLQDELARIVANGQVDEILASIQCLEQLVLARSRIFRPMDFATTCSILSEALSPNSRQSRPELSHYAVSENVINMLSSTARLRADLVAGCPAEVVGVLSSMFVLFLQPRRQYNSSAGARARVTSRWPPWLAEPTPPQSADEDGANVGGLKATHAAQLSRLLTSLCNAKLDKPRNPSRPGSASIANSLVKHVPAILVAYCRAVGDQWGSISAEIRKELEPGLWSLCEVLTAGGRVDARGREGEGLGLPFGLGEGGEVEKDVWAGMWLNWGKHRYQGKG